MHELIAAKLPEVEDLCRQYKVRRLDLFGSATGQGFDPARSDVDVLVEFDVEPGYDPDFDYVGTYFGLKEGLESLFGRSVDVVSVRAVCNPYFMQDVEETKELLYAA